MNDKVDKTITLNDYDLAYNNTDNENEDNHDAWLINFNYYFDKIHNILHIITAEIQVFRFTVTVFVISRFDVVLSLSSLRSSIPSINRCHCGDGDGDSDDDDAAVGAQFDGGGMDMALVFLTVTNRRKNEKMIFIFFWRKRKCWIYEIF